MATYVATLNISPVFREAHSQALKSRSELTGDVGHWAEAHLQYVRDLKAKGKMVAAGPTVAFTWAVMLLKADSLEEARAMVANDPGVKNGLFTDFNLEPWYHMV